jgi:hypothetical protein
MVWKGVERVATGEMIGLEGLGIEGWDMLVDVVGVDRCFVSLRI